MFSANLRRLREFSNMDKAQLARKLDISAVAVGQFESGKREPSLQTLKKISEFFGVTIDALLADENTNAAKIKELIKKFKYTIKEFALDIREPVSEIEKIVIHNVEPAPHIIESICCKYGFDNQYFTNDSEHDTFCKAGENREYIDFAMYLKMEGYLPENIKRLIKNTEAAILENTQLLKQQKQKM